MSESHRYTRDDLWDITVQLLAAAGTPLHIAGDVADILINAHLAGHDSHGVLRIPAYMRGIEEGRIQPAAEPEIVQESDQILIVDGNHGFGHYVARKGMQRAIEKARLNAICTAVFRRTGHIGRLGEYAEQAAYAGCMGMIALGGFGANYGRTTPFGGLGGKLGTNPIAIGIPVEDDHAFIIDYATSMIAEGKIQVARSNNSNVPEGCIVDREGHPSTKPGDFYDGGFLLPFGGHKGYALALWVGLLGGLSGEFDAERTAIHGTFMQVIHIDAFVPLDEYRRSAQAALDALRQTPPMHGFQKVLVPGDYEARCRKARIGDGIEIPDTVYQQLCEWGGKLGVPIHATH